MSALRLYVLICDGCGYESDWQGESVPDARQRNGDWRRVWDRRIRHYRDLCAECGEPTA